MTKFHQIFLSLLTVQISIFRQVSLYQKNQYPWSSDSIHSHCHDDVNSILNILKEFQRILGYHAPPRHVQKNPILLRTSHNHGSTLI
jgi:hypothetical protein